MQRQDRRCNFYGSTCAAARRGHRYSTQKLQVSSAAAQSATALFPRVLHSAALARIGDPSGLDWFLLLDEMAPRVKLSGIQRQALALYRGFLRTARLKAPDERQRIESVVSAEFRENARNVDRRNFVYIEYLIRKGKRQLDQLKNPDITGLSTLQINKVKPSKAKRIL
uniref:Uncharacterized protein n=1 Tax=Avena sativa TaxID=4498 RepID=A0ACD5Y3Y1_AVESA